MCGRINLTSAPHVLAERFYLDMIPDLTPRYNIAPGQDIAAVVPNPRSEGRMLRAFRWGLEPPGNPHLGRAPKLINARSETVGNKPAFREAFAHRRCLIPVNGFYEWQKRSDGSQPYLFRRRDGDVFALAGLWGTWEYPGGRSIASCAILTTAANATMRPIHHRMPVVLPAADWKLWCDLPPDRLDDLSALLGPAPNDLLVTHPVSRRVNSASCDDPVCLEPVADERRGQLDLFAPDDQGASS